MTIIDLQSARAQRQQELVISPVASDRIRSLAARVMEGAPALTAGEMRELAEAIIEHNELSEDVSD